MTRQISMTIDGAASFGSQFMDVSNPANKNLIGSVPNAGKAELDAAVCAARQAFKTWRDTDWTARQSAVNKIGEIISENSTELIAMLTAEQGKPIAQAEFEVLAAAQWCQATATFKLEDKIIEDTPEKLHFTRYDPIGVVCAISPWNFPFVLSIFKLAPALLAGNTVVLKPSPFTPMTVLRLGELVRDILPAGVLNVISGDDDLGPLMTAHPGFDKISFTGSTETGKKVMESAAKDLKRLTLELGGNDAAIVFSDVDVRQTAEKLFWSAFTNSGQVCIASKRVYIHEDIYDDMRDALVNLVKGMPMGDGSEDGIALGPVNNARQHDRVRELIAASESAGDTIIRGGEVDANGFFEPLTIIDNPPDDRPIVCEEQFGPVLPLLKFTTEDEVIERANASDTGLAATVWTKDCDRGLRVAKRLETGNVWINEGLGLSPFAAFGGRKQSGLGVENGIEGLMAYTEPKTISLIRS
ncbi:MAG: aldehyde dehydrogenase family protein [Hyphomonas sp.]